MCPMKSVSKVDKPILWSSLMISAVFVVATLVTPTGVSKVLNEIFSFFTKNLGWAYMLSAAVFVAFCIGLAVSKYGNIKLGKDDEEPEHSRGSWFAMLFAAGMGIGLVFWGVAEPIMHFNNSPFADSKTPEAASIAMRTVLFHWGLHPWAFYAVVALALAYFQYCKGLPGLISSTLYPLIGEKGIRGPIGKSIDAIAVIVTLFGVATSLGLGAKQLTSGMNFVYGLPNTTTVAVVLIAIMTVLFIISAVTGIDKGIKFLSNTNMVIAFLLMLFLLTVGPTRYILNIFSESIGAYLQNIVSLSFFMDTQGTVAKHTGYDWIGSWTVFYWAWWITWAPFVGSFIARISKGRTIREFMVGILVAPTLLSAIWFSIIGGSALNIELFGSGGIGAAVDKDVPSGIFVMLSHFPLSSLMDVLLMILLAIFFITSADSATFVVAMFTSGGDLNPDNRLKIVWGVVEGALAAILLVAGGLSAVQTVSFMFSFPFIIIMILMVVSLVKDIGQGQKKTN